MAGQDANLLCLATECCPFVVHPSFKFSASPLRAMISVEGFILVFGVCLNTMPSAGAFSYRNFLSLGDWEVQNQGCGLTQLLVRSLPGLKTTTFHHVLTSWKEQHPQGLFMFYKDSGSVRLNRDAPYGSPKHNHPLQVLSLILGDMNLQA